MLSSPGGASTKSVMPVARPSCGVRCLRAESRDRKPGCCTWGVRWAKKSMNGPNCPLAVCYKSENQRALCLHQSDLERIPMTRLVIVVYFRFTSVTRAGVGRTTTWAEHPGSDFTGKTVTCLWLLGGWLEALCQVRLGLTTSISWDGCHRGSIVPGMEKQQQGFYDNLGDGNACTTQG